MKSLKFLPLLILALSLAGCIVIPTENVKYYSCGLVPEVMVVSGTTENANKLYINNISGEKIRSVKLVYSEATFDEAKRNAEPNWSDYDNVLKSSISDKNNAYCDLKPWDSVKTLWVKVDTGDRHCVFAVVYEAGCRIEVNVRSSDT